MNTRRAARSHVHTEGAAGSSPSASASTSRAHATSAPNATVA
jgi:hypothetical protein